MWKDPIRKIVVIFQTIILRIVGFYVRHSAHVNFKSYTGGPQISWFLVPRGNHEIRGSWNPGTFKIKIFIMDHCVVVQYMSEISRCMFLLGYWSSFLIQFFVEILKNNTSSFLSKYTLGFKGINIIFLDTSYFFL